MENKCIIEISTRAYFSIKECVSFVNNVSNIAAKELYKEILSSINSLTIYPNKYPEVDGLSIKNAVIRKMTIHKGRYAILYKLEGNVIFIYDVIDIRKECYLCLEKK